MEREKTIRNPDGTMSVITETISDEEAAVIQAEWDANALAVYEVLIPLIKAEGLRLINKRFPAINSFDDLFLEAERWMSLSTSSKNATVDYQYMIDVYTAGRAAIVNVKTFTTQAEVDAYDVLTNPVWP